MLGISQRLQQYALIIQLWDMETKFHLVKVRKPLVTSVKALHNPFVDHAISAPHHSSLHSSCMRHWLREQTSFRPDVHGATSNRPSSLQLAASDVCAHDLPTRRPVSVVHHTPHVAVVTSGLSPMCCEPFLKSKGFHRGRHCSRVWSMSFRHRQLKGCAVRDN